MLDSYKVHFGQKAWDWTVIFRLLFDIILFGDDFILFVLWLYFFLI